MIRINFYNMYYVLFIKFLISGVYQKKVNLLTKKFRKQVCLYPIRTRKLY